MDTRTDESWREFNPRGCIKCRRGEAHYHDSPTDCLEYEIVFPPDTQVDWLNYVSGLRHRPRRAESRPWLDHPETAGIGLGDEIAA